MFASTVSKDFCQLFCVIRTDKQTGKRKALYYPPSDYLTCIYRAQDYQTTFDPSRSRFDYRVAHFN